MPTVPDGAPILVHRVIARLNVGGPAMHVVNLAAGMAPERWRTRLIAGAVPEGEGDMRYYAEARSVDVTYLPSMSREIRPGSDLAALWALFRLFRRERPAVVHTHTAKAGTLGRLAATLARVPVRVHTYHGHVLGGGYFSRAKTRLFLAVERLLARFTSTLVVLTGMQKREMSGALRIAPEERFAVVPLGLELGRFAAMDRSALRAEARRALGLEDETLVIGIVGRLVPIKNHELFLETLAALAREGAQVAGLVVGSGEREAELRAAAERTGLADRVRWLGWRKDLEALYAAMDLLLLTSHDEGTPVAVLEALAAGTPVLARDVGGVAEVLEGVGHGFLVPRGEGAPGWAERAASMADAPPASRDDRDRVRARYSVERLVADLEALYLSALGRT